MAPDGSLHLVAADWELPLWAADSEMQHSSQRYPDAILEQWVIRASACSSGPVCTLTGKTLLIPQIALILSV